MNGVVFPADCHLERLRREHPRQRFRCGQQAVDHWLATKALQHQTKHLSVTKVLIDDDGAIAGYYTLATGQIDFSDLPPELAKQLPRRVLPVAVLAWLGVDLKRQGQGLGRLLLAQALRDCWEAGKTFPFIAVILDCLNASTKKFYQHWDFAELPGHPYRLFLSAKCLDAMMN
ncbi:MAG: GNAT family N-acetyltransferase [Pirellulales bacterium]|nr:GNAT family N-acetyltransferase [Pirellulales bacterium]